MSRPRHCRLLRALGASRGAGEHVIDSLNHIDQRAIASLEPELQR